MAESPSIDNELAVLDEYISDLREIQPGSYSAFEQDKMLRRYAERLLHMAIETCIRLGLDILVANGFRAPENYHDIFIVLGEHQLLGPDLVRSMTGLVELRNLLIYEHESIDQLMVYSTLIKRVEDFKEFARSLRAVAAGIPYTPAVTAIAELDDE